jgi:hypothetical protein
MGYAGIVGGLGIVSTDLAAVRALGLLHLIEELFLLFFRHLRLAGWIVGAVLLWHEKPPSDIHSSGAAGCHCIVIAGEPTPPSFAAAATEGGRLRVLRGRRRPRFAVRGGCDLMRVMPP